MTDKINQDLQIFQQLIKTATENPENSGINIVYIGQVRIGTQEIENTDIPSSTIPATMTPVTNNIKRIGLQEYDYEGLEKILENLPTPRFDALLNAAITIALKLNKNQRDASDWLGVKEARFNNWLARLGLRFKDRKY